MQLFMSPASPFVRTVRVMIREAGITDMVEELEISTNALDTNAALAAANPVGKIPTLARPDGPAVHDSRVIARYLDQISDAGLYPTARLWEVLTLEATAHGAMDAAVGMVYEARFKGTDGKSADWIEAQWQKVARALDALEARWMSHLNGPVDMAQVAVACMLGYLDLRHPGRDWRATRPQLAAWEAAFSERPAMVDTKPPA
ncbi:glutathione S-transferase family protein [Pelagovum pacificum]|uniref:Glutathione S-transferase family protein n=1 Tax=Pelagovum pacificum TaxID=2588711 RepID=A0A5C5GJR4_9RHOB|nr:glutathione S-transferase family protein [Pelagovum pacificum]QQA44863.1 glutathione S-transferase family protein [Pelagovum pacificum]TNY34387.1 glutathione S-transferase family protein [Pelagovum pacificum]